MPHCSVCAHSLELGQARVGLLAEGERLQLRRLSGASARRAGRVVHLISGRILDHWGRGAASSCIARHPCRTQTRLATNTWEWGARAFLAGPSSARIQRTNPQILNWKSLRRRLHILFLAALRAMPPSTECALAVRIVQLEYEMVPSAALFDPASSPLTGMPIRCAALQTLARCRPCVLD